VGLLLFLSAIDGLSRPVVSRIDFDTLKIGEI
jgi:hypothetical protein